MPTTCAFCGNFEGLLAVGHRPSARLRAILMAGAELADGGLFVRPFRQLRVWQEAHGLTLEVYRVTARYPAPELYGLTSQMRRSAASIATNIAEGSVRSDSEFRQFLRVALGSSAELEYQLMLSHDLGYLPDESSAELQRRVESVKRMLTVFIRRTGATASRATSDGRWLTAEGQPSEGGRP
jgi:four helix bundle protein